MSVAVRQTRGLSYNRTIGWQNSLSGKETSMTEDKSDTIVFVAFHLSCLSDVIMAAAPEEKTAFAEFKVSEAQWKPEGMSCRC